jgi:hypothetical protein
MRKVKVEFEVMAENPLVDTDLDASKVVVRQ